MNAILIYDVSTRVDEVKTELLRLGYYERWLSNEKTYILPNSVAWKPNIELSAAIEELQGIINRLNSIAGRDRITLLRCISLSANPWSGIEGFAT
jgi:hypothetical protein